jgi:hypothetical protein
MFINIFIYLLPFDLCSIDNHIHLLQAYTPMDVVDNLSFDYICLMGIHQTNQITFDAVL